SADPIAVLRQLESLVGASLLLVAQTRAGEPRFSMLETIRDYALERLEETGDGPPVRARHLAWYVGLAERAAAELSGPQQDRWLDLLELEHSNLQAALNHASPPDEAGLRLVFALWRFWYTRGYLADGRRWLEAAVAAEGGSAASRALALH